MNKVEEQNEQIQKQITNREIGLKVSRDTKLRKNLPGILLVLLIAFASNSVGQDIPLIGATVFAIIFGVLIRNFIGVPIQFNPGIQYSLKTLLKLSIILLGSSLNLLQVFTIGSKSIWVIIAVVVLGILLTAYIGRKLDLSGNIPSLIGIGTAICGATAIATVSPIMKAKEEETAFAITTIFVFNIIAVLTYPILGALFGMSDEVFGIWAGTSIHDTSSVVAAGYVFSDEAGGIATVVKLTRTLFLVPLAILIGIYISIKVNRKNEKKDKVKFSKIFPWFLLGFLGMSILNTIGFFNESLIEQITNLSKFMILMAMASVGLGADFNKIRKIGLKPIYLGLIASILVGTISISIIYMMI